VHAVMMMFQMTDHFDFVKFGLDKLQQLVLKKTDLKAYE
jgi:hypothetical protein